VTVGADEVRCGLAPLGTGQLARRAERAEDQVREGSDARSTEDGDRDRPPGELVAELDRRGIPGEQTGRARDHDPEWDEERGDRADRRMADVEAIPAPPEKGRRRPGQHRLLEVEALDQCDRSEHEQQAERELPGPVPSHPQVEGDDHQRDAERHGQGVEDRHDLHRLKLKQDVVPPGDVGREGRGEIDEPDGECDRRCQRGQPLGTSDRPEGSDSAVQADAPGGGVPLRGQEIAPVLEHQPEAEGADPAHQRRRLREVRRESAEGQNDEGGAEMPLVEPSAEHVHARAERMALESNHPDVRRGLRRAVPRG
jgi:hypothetical protein